MQMLSKPEEEHGFHHVGVMVFQQPHVMRLPTVAPEDRYPTFGVRILPATLAGMARPSLDNRRGHVAELRSFVLPRGRHSRLQRLNHIGLAQWKQYTTEHGLGEPLGGLYFYVREGEGTDEALKWDKVMSQAAKGPRAKPSP